jgi:dCMP deaminase
MQKQWFTDLDVLFAGKDGMDVVSFLNEYAKRSPDLKKQVGAIILAEDGRICALGYNQLVDGYPSITNPADWFDPSWKEFAIIHAEHDALVDLQTYGNHVLRPAYAMIITHTPCAQCSKLLTMNETIRNVHIIKHESKRQNSVDFLEKMGFNVSIDKTV